jgi:hypothetical protein
MPTDGQTLELLRLYHALDRKSQWTLLMYAKLLEANPPSFRPL